MTAPVALLLIAQMFEQRGFLETPLLAYPRAAPGDSGRFTAEALLRYEVFWRASPQWKLSFGADGQTDTHRQAFRDFTFSWLDRTRQRQAVAIRRASVAYQKKRWTVEVGKQFIRWGKTDVLTPTDRFAPRDYTNFARTDLLAVTAARATWGGDADTVDFAYSPRFTPSRTPLLNQRWAGPIAEFNPVFADPEYPGAGQFGFRWNHAGRRAEFATAFYEGFNPLPIFDVAFTIPEFRLRFAPRHAQMRMIGGDLSVPLPWFTVKTEAAYFASRTQSADEYWLYVVEAERQWGEWIAVIGYAGEAVMRRRQLFDFAADRGLTRTILGTLRYTIDANRSIAAETAVRQNGRGSLLKIEYSQAAGAHWRVTGGYSWIRGAGNDFLGQFRANSFGFLTLRYSF
jgi:hypothetical protein